MDAKDTKSEQKDDQKIYNSNPSDTNIYNNSPSNIPPPPPPRRENEGTLQSGPMYWMRIEDYATQIRIVALQARCGAAVSLEQIQKAHELALKMQEDLRPLLYAAQVPPNFSSNSPMFQNRPPVMNGVNSNWTDKPTYSPMKNTMSVFSNTTDSTMKMFPQQSLSTEASPKTIKRQKRKRQQDELERACKSCNTTETPEWRRGPLGPRTLCNACGLKWAKKVKAEKNRPEGSDFTEEELSNTSDQTNTTPPRPTNPEFTQFIQTNTQNPVPQSPNSQKLIQPNPVNFANQKMPIPQAQLPLQPQKFPVSLQPQSFHQHSMPLQHQMHLQSQNHSNSPPSLDRPQLPTGSLNQSPQPYLQTQSHLVQTQNESLQDSDEKDQVGNISQPRTADGTESDEDRIDETMVDSQNDPQIQDVDIEDTHNEDFVTQLEDKIGDETDDQTTLHVEAQDDNLPPSPPQDE